MEELFCPFCGCVVRIIVCDDEGNHKSDEYENDPWSGLGYMLYHPYSEAPDCPISHDDDTQLGCRIYDTRDDAVELFMHREF